MAVSRHAMPSRAAFRADLPLILLAGGAIGAAMGMAAVFVNAAILRGSVSTGAKIALMIVVLGVAAVLWLVAAVALQVAIS